ncbi:DUF2000 domain-containing protein [Caballeronia glebae]|uniref:DUF2000 domain-containing protein n=1 Tax=Caballeronia glebae TaxID=1777143 RepID=UPI0038B7CA77
MEKGIIIVDENVPLGLKANISAILGMTFGKRFPNVVGNDVSTIDGKTIAGITQIPLPILQSSCQRISEIFMVYRDSEIFVAVFDNSALTTKNYLDYEEKIASGTLSQIKVHGLLAYGSKKAINKISADLPLLK